MTTPTLAVVGGGASGTILALHLLEELGRTGGRAEILLLDRDGRHGLGQAYGTADPRHLLNAPAARMSALAGDPGHFARWAGAAGPEFLPREAYGRYLVDSLLRAEQSAWPYVRLRRVTGEVVGAGPGGVRLADGRGFAASAVVLATGNPPPASAGTDPWAPGALEALAGARRVLVRGAGLTALDVAVTLCSAGAEVHLVSRTGLLPRVHGTAGPAELRLPPAPAGLGEILRAVREAVAAAGGEWRPVVDALRPHVPALWAGLPAHDQRRFLALLSRTWEVHRHRVPPATAAAVAELRAAGRVHLHVGAPPPGLAADAVVAATGPGPAGGDRLLAALFAAGTARADHLGLGVDAMPDGALRDGAGRVQPWLSALGPPLRGVRWETTAVPEICGQAAALAYRLVRALMTNARVVVSA